MTDDSAGCFLKGHDCCRPRWLKGEELGGLAVLLSATPFMSFDVKTREESSKRKQTWFKGACLRTPAERSGPLIFLDFVQLLSKLGGVGAAEHFEYSWWAGPRCQTLDARLYISSESTQTFEGLRALWLFHSLRCDAGTGGQPCGEIQALYSSRQLLEWVWIYQPVICAMPLPTPPPSPPTAQN